MKLTFDNKCNLLFFYFFLFNCQILHNTGRWKILLSLPTITINRLQTLTCKLQKTCLKEVKLPCHSQHENFKVHLNKTCIHCKKSPGKVIPFLMKLFCCHISRVDVTVIFVNVFRYIKNEHPIVKLKLNLRFLK